MSNQSRGMKFEGRGGPSASSRSSIAKSDFRECVSVDVRSFSDPLRADRCEVGGRAASEVRLSRGGIGAPKRVRTAGSSSRL